MTPVAISRQNSRSTSRRSAGAPGDFIGDRPVNSVIHPAGLPINASTIEVLRRPVESGQFLSIRYTEHLAEAGVEGSVGSKGDSYGNALAESFNGLYKTEMIYHEGPWKGPDDVEWATLTFVHWFNHTRLHREIGMLPPAEFKAVFYDHNTPAISAGCQTAGPHIQVGGSLSTVSGTDENQIGEGIGVGVPSR